MGESIYTPHCLFLTLRMTVMRLGVPKQRRGAYGSCSIAALIAAPLDVAVTVSDLEKMADRNGTENREIEKKGVFMVNG